MKGRCEQLPMLEPFGSTQVQQSLPWRQNQKRHSWLLQTLIPALTALLLLLAKRRLICRIWWSLFSSLSEAVRSSGTWMEEKRAHVSFTATSCAHLIYPETIPLMAEAQDLLSQMGFSAPNEILGCLLQHTLTVVSRTLEGYLKDACKP